MDFTQFDSVKRAESGFDYHIKCAATGKPLFDNSDDIYADNGKPCLVTLKGREAASVRAALREAGKARALAEKDKGDEDEETSVNFDEVHDLMVTAGCIMIKGFKNIDREERPAKAKDADWFLNLNRFTGPSEFKSFVEQVTEAANDRAQVLGNASKG
ncbi:hypothetical protein [Shimia sagamensis]|uniref:DUF3276 family protein n=1 Tax=Shimia sagamensis TaxID=1566352 RepID=A0ABY1PEQ1_9RHOB|nr:hypothetical protein [Shimia sagamensis]SMP32186.1 hypothetical protein SAMN06265373_108145 [Shimia sagamensis]